MSSKTNLHLVLSICNHLAKALEIGVKRVSKESLGLAVSLLIFGLTGFGLAYASSSTKTIIVASITLLMMAYVIGLALSKHLSNSKVTQYQVYRRFYKKTKRLVRKVEDSQN